MKIKIDNDGLRNREGGFLRTYEYSFVTDELIEVFHLEKEETISWQSSTKTNLKNEEEKPPKKIKGPTSDPWVKMEIEAFLIHVHENHGKVFIHIASDMIELQDIELTEKGLRSLPLSKSSLEVLRKIKEYYPNSDSEYVFATPTGTITTVTFNRHLNKHCEALGICKKSSHDIRFSSASTLYAATKDITDIQQACGHTTLTMAQHYVKQIKSMEDQKNNYLNALG